MDNIKEKLELLAFGKYNKNVNNLTVGELYDVLGTLVISNVSPDWQKSMKEHINSRRAYYCLLYTSPSPRDRTRSRMPSSA